MLLDTDLVNKALDIAAVAHDGQKDKAGMPYILHPIRVATQLDTETEQICGILHDVVEDTDITADRIRSEFGDEIADAIICLTHLDGESYDDYIERVKTNPLAVKVKLADIHHNMQPGRIKNPTEKDIKRKAKYIRALAQLGA